MNTSTRIRHYLQTKESATVMQLCRALGLTKADIHYHMRLLLKEGVIDLLPESYQAGAGRPARQYKLIKPAPETLSRLIINLLLDFLNQNKNAQINSQTLADFIAAGILAQCCHFKDQCASSAIRLTRIITELSKYGIHLRWLACKEGPEIHLEQEYLSTLIRDPALVRSIISHLLLSIQKMVAG